MPWPSRIRTPRNEILLRSMWKDKRTVVDIARAINASPDTVYNWLHALGLKEKKRRNGCAPCVRREEPVETVQRKCLTCLKMFPSSGAGNRRCQGCKELEIYRGGAGIFEL